MMQHVRNALSRDAAPAPTLVRKAEPHQAARAQAPEPTVLDVVRAATAAEQAQNPSFEVPDRPSPRMADVRRTVAEQNFDRPTEPTIADYLRACREGV
jgi:hypothetical protein